MKPKQTPFNPGWWSFDLAEYRPCNGTYCLFPYGSLPPIPSKKLQGDFEWLLPADSQIDAKMQVHRSFHNGHAQMANNLA